MDVWLVNPYGPIPGEGWRDYRFTLIGEALASRGHRVTWWTASFAHQTKRFRARGWSFREASERFTIELVPTPAYRRNIGVRRLWFEWMFAHRFEQRAASRPAPDVIIGADPPQFCGAATRRVAARSGIPLVIECLDLWPELFVSAAPKLLRPLVRLAALPLYALRRRNVASAALVIAVCETYRRVLEKDQPRTSAVIPIGVDLKAFDSSLKKEPRSKVTVVYAGSLGEAYDLDTVVMAAAQLADEGVEFVIAGVGPADKRLRTLSARLGAKNIKFAGAVAPLNLAHLYAGADIGVAAYAEGSTVVLPLKVFDYLAAGLPIITSLRGEALQILENAGAGVSYRAGDAASLAQAVRGLALDRERRDMMAASARRAASQFDVVRLYEQYAVAIESLC